MKEVADLSKGNRVLDLFSGIGRHSIELARRGYAVTSVEYQKDYIKIAKRDAGRLRSKIKFIRGDVRKVKFGEGFDTVLIMYNSFGYFNDRDEHALLKKIAYTIKSGGNLILEILNRDWIERNFLPSSERKVGDLQIIEKRKYLASKHRMHSVLRYFKANKELGKITMSWRLYTFPEIKKLLENTGFSVIETFEDMKARKISPATRLMQIVSKRD